MPSSLIHDLFDLTGQVAVIIGGTGELCGAMAEGLAGAGATVAGTAGIRAGPAGGNDQDQAGGHGGDRQAPPGP